MEKFFPNHEPNTTLTLEDIASRFNLGLAHMNARKGKSRYDSVQEVDENRDKLLAELRDLILSKKYRTSEYRRQIIQDSRKEREIYKLPYYPDRIVQWAIMLQIGYLFLERYSPHSHAAIRGRGTHSAMHEVEHILRTDREGSKYCLKIDVRKFFPSVNHTVLKAMVDELVTNQDLREMQYEIIDSVPEGEGLPIGNYYSQYAANLYLTPLDYMLEEHEGVCHFVRYMDDVVIFGRTKEELRRALWDVEWFLYSRLCLRLKQNWQIFPVDSRGVDFAGFRVFRNRTLMRKTTFRDMRRRRIRLARRTAITRDISYHHQCSLMSDDGMIVHCTRKVRNDLHTRYIRPTMENVGIAPTKKMQKRYI